jgi:hypothetical protein
MVVYILTDKSFMLVNCYLILLESIMSDKIKALSSHGINYNVDGDRLLAEEAYTLNGNVGTSWVDVTSWTLSQLATWLGY